MSAIESATYAFRGTHPTTGGTPIKYGLGGDASLIQSCHARWDATFVGVITFWVCDFPEVALTSVVAGDWIQLDPPTGYTPVSPAGAATTATPLVITVPGGTAGGAAPDVGNLGHRVLAAQVVCTVAGFLKLKANGKE